MKSLKKVVSLFLCICLLLPFTVAEGYFHTSSLSNRFGILFDMDNLLGVSEANAVCQTSDGYLWVGSYAGLFRYNGNEFEAMSGTAGGISYQGIRTRYEASAGTLYIGRKCSAV